MFLRTLFLQATLSRVVLRNGALNLEREMKPSKKQLAKPFIIEAIGIACVIGFILLGAWIGGL